MSGVNPVRGEAVAKIGSLSIVLTMTLDDLAKVSAATGCQTLDEVYRRLHGTEPSMVMEAIRQCTQGGEVDGKTLARPEAVSQAWSRMTIDDFNGLQGPFDKLLASLLRKSDGKEPPLGNGDSAQSG